MTAPTGGFDVGTAFVQIALSLRGVEKDAAKAGAEAGKAFVASFDEEVVRKSTPLPVPGKPESRKQGTESGGAFADAFSAKVKAAFKALPKAKVGVDATTADAELQHIREQLQGLGDVRVGVDLSAAEATAELDKLKARLDALGSSSPDVQVRADVAAASAQLEAFQRQVDKLDGSKAEVKVDADTGSAETKVSRLVSGLGKTKISLGFAAPDISSLLPVQSAIGALTAVAVAGAPVLFALGSSAGFAATSLAALIPAAAGAGFALGTLTAALSGPLSALKAYRAAQKESAAATTQASAVSTRSAASELSNAKAIRDAQENIADARRQQGRVAENVAEQIRSAQQRVSDAERGVADAQYDALRAQQDLNEARKQAAADLQDLQDKLAGFALDEEGAEIALARAVERAQKTAKDKKATALDQRDAAYDVAVAQARLIQVQKDGKKAQAELAAAQKAGVKGNAGVVKATDDVAKANRRVQDSQAGLTESEHDLAVTRRSAAEQQADAARTVQKAVRSLADVQAAQAAAAKDQAEAAARQAAQSNKAGAAATKYAQALAKLTPAGRTFLKTLIGFGPLVDKLQSAAETATLPGLTKFLNDSKSLFPLATRGVSLFGKAIGDSAASLGQYVKSAIFRADFAKLLDSTSKSTRNFGLAATPLASILTTIATAAAPLLERFSAFILRGLKLVDVFLQSKQATGDLGKFFKGAGDEMAKWGRIVGNFAGGLLDLFKQANPAGQTLADRLLAVSRNFRDWTSSTKGTATIRKFFQFFADLDYGRLFNIAKTAGELLLAYKGFMAAGSLAKNPFFFLLALAAIKNPDAVSGFVSDVWSAAEPMVNFLAAHSNVFAGFIGLLAALRLTAAAKGLPGLFKGLPGLSGVLGGGGSDGPIAGAKDLKSRKPGSPFNPIVTAGGGDVPGAPGGKGKGGGFPIASAGLAATIALALAPFVKGASDRAQQKQGSIGDAAILSSIGRIGPGFEGLSPQAYAQLLKSYEKLHSFYVTTIPGWVRTGFGQIGAFLSHPTVPSVAGLATAYVGVQAFFTARVPSWARTGLSAVTGFFTHPLPVATTGLAAAYLGVQGFLQRTTPSWARTGMATISSIFGKPTVVGVAGFGSAYAGVKGFFLTTIPSWAKSGASLVSSAFSVLQTELVKPINWIITNVLNRLIGAANFVITKFGGSAIAPFPLIGANAPTSKPAAGGNSGSGGRNIRLASGGVMPGYTPGRDVHQFISPTGGHLALSGGEAVMRPEWTQAVGPAAVDRLNALARRGGASAVRRAMGGPGAFALGGIIGKVKTVADWGKAGIRTLQQAAAGGLHGAVEFLLAPIRAALEAPQAGSLFASLTGGAINKVVAEIFGYADAQPQVGDPSGGGGGSAVNIPANVTARIAAIQSFLRSTDPLPYIWGGTGPGGYDCSGIASAVYGMLTGRGGGHGQRYFTTSSNFASLGFRPGTASDFVIGVNPGTHMDGRLGGLPFEAQSTATGIFVGSGATPTSRFRQQFYLPGVSATGGSAGGKNIAAAAGGVLNFGKYDSGGMLQPGLNLALNATGKPEPVFTAAQGNALMSNADRARGGNTYNLDTKNYGREISPQDLLTKLRNQEALASF